MTTKVCIKCNLPKPTESFKVTKKYKDTFYYHHTCRECERGHPTGFAGKISQEESKALIGVAAANVSFAKWDKPLADIHSETNLTMNLQAWYRYNRIGAVQAWLEKQQINLPN